MSDVVMPRLSDSMEEGTILKWLKQDGEVVHRGEGLVDIETDKANMTYEADQDGVLEIVAQEGDTLPIGQVIARFRALAEGGDGATAAPVRAPAEADESGVATTPSSPLAAAAPARTPVASPPAAGAPAAGTAAAAPPEPGPAERIKASPVARRIARERGVELAGLTGTGPGGRIVRADVEAAVAGAPADGRPAPVAPAPEAAPAPAAPTAAAPSPAPAPAAPAAALDLATAKGQVTTQEPSRSQRVIARRMAESKATIPDFSLQAEVDMYECRALRERLRTLTGDAPLPTYNDMIVKASALALREFPRANASYRDGHFELYSRVNVGLAVATEDSLVVPTVFDADSRSLGEIAREARALADRVRTGHITPPELSGGTFTVSNLGMFGIHNFTAVINPPQAAILAVGAITDRAVPRDGELVARPVMSVTLGCDHRILYGADAARFLARIRELLEQPLALAL